MKVMGDLMYRDTYIEVNLDLLKSNVKSIIENYPEYQYYIGVVKGNGYGHGAYIINALIEQGINYLAVSSLEEAIELREMHSHIPILCLEPISIQYIELAYQNNITLTVSSLRYIDELLKVLPNAKDLKIHIKVNTGMNRLGFKNRNDLEKGYEIIREKYTLEGIYTHLITTGISDPFWDKQIQTFKYLTEKIPLDEIPIVHIGRSITMVNHPKLEMCNGIRLGIIMYGFDQTPKPLSTWKGKLKQYKAKWRIKKYNISPTTLNCKAILEPAFSLYSRIIEIQEIEKGEHVGYGLGYTASEKERIAIVPIGYADGFNRNNTGRQVFIKNKKYTIIGSVNMGMIQIKVDSQIKEGDIVELMGKHIPIRYVASYLKTTPYECMCMLSDSLPRIYIQNNKVVHIERRKIK